MPLGFFDINTSGRIRKIIDDNAGVTHSFLAHQLPDLAATFLAVSYTHLNRDRCYRALFFEEFAGRKFYTGSQFSRLQAVSYTHLITKEPMRNSGMCNKNTVSYTHLDVYKRQEYGTRIYQNLCIWSVQTIDADLLEATILAICLHTDVYKRQIFLLSMTRILSASVMLERR